MEVWSIVFGGRGVGLRSALEPLGLVVIYSVTPFPCLKADKEDEQTTQGRVCGRVCEGGGGSLIHECES